MERVFRVFQLVAPLHPPALKLAASVDAVPAAARVNAKPILVTWKSRAWQHKLFAVLAGKQAVRHLGRACDALRMDDLL